MIGVGLALVAQLLSPSAFVLGAIAEHPIVFVGDVHPYAEPKRVIATVLRTMTVAHPVRLLGLEIAAEQQTVIDRYLATTPEDTTILIANPRTLRDHWGASEEYLDIYRAAWAWNAAHRDLPIRVAAIDVPRWPLFEHSEAMAAGSFADRDRIMTDRFMREWKKLNGAGGALIFMGGLHGLRTLGGEVHVGRATEKFDHWFAGNVEAAGLPVYTIFTDAPLQDGHGATRVYDRLAAGTGSSIVALDSTSDVDAEPMYAVAVDGYSLAFVPSRFHLRDVVQAMFVLRQPTMLTPIAALVR